MSELVKAEDFECRWGGGEWGSVMHGGAPWGYLEAIAFHGGEAVDTLIVRVNDDPGWEIRRKPKPPVLQYRYRYGGWIRVLSQDAWPYLDEVKALLAKLPLYMEIPVDTGIFRLIEA